MSIDLKKEELTINKLIMEQLSDVFANGDVIVPDSKPDIEKILQIDGRAVIKSRDIAGNKVTISGTAEFSVLYLPEADDYPARCIKASIPFQDVFEASTADCENIYIYACAEICSIDFSLLNSRKLNISSTIALEVKVYCQSHTEIVCALESNIPLEIKTKNIQTYSVVCDREIQITVPDKIEIPSDNYPIGEILKMNARVAGQDIRMVTGKAIVKGIINLQTLYLAPSPDVPVQFMEHEIPFTEVLDLPGVSEETDCDIDYALNSIYYETDDDEESSVLGVEVLVDVHARAIRTDILSVPEDCYSTSCDIAISHAERDIDYISGANKNRITVRGSVTLPYDAPKIVQLLGVVAKPFIEDIQTDDTVLIKGTLDVYLLYMTDDASVPLYSIKDEIPFEVSGDITSGCKNPHVECSISLINCGFNVSGDDSVDIRANMDVSLKLICTEKVLLIENVQECENASSAKAPSFTVYFTKENDTLWNIGKRYKTTPQKIAALNELDVSHPLPVAKAIIIPR